jgi:hypothetical protein
MAITSSQVATDGVVQKPLHIEKISQGIVENLFLTKLLTDVSDSFVPGADQFTAYQWGLAGDVENTLENGSEQSDGGMPVFKQVIPCDQDKKNSLYVYDKASLISALDYDRGFFATAPFKHARALDSYVAGLMRTAADASITCNEDDELDKDTLRALATAMDVANLPKEGRILVVRSEQKHALIKNFNLADSSIAGTSSELRSGNTARIYGFDIYEDNSNILPTNDANQAMAFTKDSCFWGLQKEVETEVERQASKSRHYLGCRSKWGAKVNTFKNADGADVKRIYLVGKQA